MEASRAGNPESAALVRRVVEQAVQQCAELDAPRRIERMPMRRYGMALAATALVALLAAVWGPGAIRNGFAALLQFSSDLQAAVVPYRIEVTPGSVSVPKGADQKVTAALVGFGSDEAVIMARRAPSEPFEVVPLILAESGGYEGMLFDINAPLEYYVEAEGVRSGTFTVKVVELQYVQRMDLEYRYPSYTGLEPETVEDGGDMNVEVKKGLAEVQKDPQLREVPISWTIIEL